MPNPRGSTGFGQQFTNEISGDWGGKVYTDLMNGVAKVAAMPFVDKQQRRRGRAPLTAATWSTGCSATTTTRA